MNYFFIAIAFVFIWYIFSMIRKKTFSIKESIFWMIGNFFIIVFATFPKLLDKIAYILHIEYPPSLLFLLSICFLLFINFRNTKKMTIQNTKTIELAQKLSVLEFEVANLKKENKTKEKNK